MENKRGKLSEASGETIRMEESLLLMKMSSKRQRNLIEYFLKLKTS
tara:strand:- start:819 stop:956 length:138 start_codon:yes stop_codon:yes gene_type:complete